MSNGGWFWPGPVTQSAPTAEVTKLQSEVAAIVANNDARWSKLGIEEPAPTAEGGKLDSLAEAIELLEPVLDDGGTVDALAVASAMHSLYQVRAEHAAQLDERARSYGSAAAAREKAERERDAAQAEAERLRDALATHGYSPDADADCANCGGAGTYWPQGGDKFTPKACHCVQTNAARPPTAKSMPLLHLPAQMGELRKKLEAAELAVFEGMERGSFERDQGRALRSLIEAALRLVPVPHDDQQGGKPVAP